MADGIFTAGNAPASSSRKGVRPGTHPGTTKPALGKPLGTEANSGGPRSEGATAPAAAAATAYAAPSDADLIRWFSALTRADRQDIYREAAGLPDASTGAAPDPWTPDRDRIGLAIDALAQADALLEIVRGQLPNEFHTNALTGLLARVEQLHDAAAAAITDEADTAARLDRVIFGRRLPNDGAVAAERAAS